MPNRTSVDAVGFTYGRYAALVAAMRSAMPRTRLLLMAVLPDIGLYTLQAYPDEVFFNLTTRWPAAYNQGGKAVNAHRLNE
jgi:hypothetical protein